MRLSETSGRGELGHKASGGALFATGVVGSLPRPQFVRELLEAGEGEMVQRQMDAAVRYAVALQERAGLDVVTDGEWRRRSYIGVIAELAHGFELGRAPDGRPWTVVTGRLAPHRSGFIAEEIHFVRTCTDRAVKATLPSPALLGERLWDAGASSGAYPDRRHFVSDCADILRDELKRVRDAGADVIQIDDPHLCLFVDPDVRAGYDDPEAAADFAVEMVNRMVDGVTGVKLAVHLCRRAGARARGEHTHHGDYGPILRQLTRLQVQQLTMEFSGPDAGEMDILRGLDQRFEIGLGCVGTTPGVVDSVEAIVARVEAALQYVPAERIVLNPDCGFAPGSAARVEIDEVYQKLKNEVEAAQTLRRRYAGADKPAIGAV
ncbi:MAG TPA: cobalamin-independent methionine synthase II family protein [Limnochordia bacterium]|nr:cobalamin-independent methionine synthase II family protein [Limnochordia bacterium]